MRKTQPWYYTHSINCHPPPPNCRSNIQTQHLVLPPPPTIIVPNNHHDHHLSRAAEIAIAVVGIAVAVVLFAVGMLCYARHRGAATFMQYRQFATGTHGGPVLRKSLWNGALDWCTPPVRRRSRLGVETAGDDGEQRASVGLPLVGGKRWSVRIVDGDGNLRDYGDSGGPWIGKEAVGEREGMVVVRDGARYLGIDKGDSGDDWSETQWSEAAVYGESDEGLIDGRSRRGRGMW
jgi:hypothetical protein